MDQALAPDEYDPQRCAEYEAFKARLRRWCIWSWPVCIVGFGVGFAVLAGFIPPPGESWSAGHIASFYASGRTAIRAGLIIAMFFSVLLMPFFTVISAEMRKIEGRSALLAPIQFGFAVVLVTFFQIICLLWLEASFRHEISAQIIRAENDYGWLVWTILIPTYSGQFLCMAVAGFMDFRRDPLWPRWAAYANVWVAITGAGGVLAVFFKTGPFSWTGVMGFWVPVFTFAAGMTMNMVLILRRDARLAVAGRSTTTGAPPPPVTMPAVA